MRRRRDKGDGVWVRKKDTEGFEEDTLGEGLGNKRSTTWKGQKDKDSSRGKGKDTQVIDFI